MIVGKDEVKIDSDKVAVLKNREPPDFRYDTRSFVDFVNLYQWFKKGFTDILQQLNMLSGKGVRYR